MIEVKSLSYKDVPGAGKQIYAHINKPVNCAEFTMKGNHPQCVVVSPLEESGLKFMIGYEPWIQFEPKEWSDMMEIIFHQMVDAWNEKHGNQKE